MKLNVIGLSKYKKKVHRCILYSKKDYGITKFYSSTLKKKEDLFHTKKISTEYSSYLIYRGIDWVLLELYVACI